MEAWLEAVISQLGALAARFGTQGFRTVYVGGGTPSCLPERALSRLLSAVSGLSPEPPDEWTVEANPEDLSPALLSLLSGAGVDRVSVGVQSLEPEARRLSGRRGDPGSCLGRLESLAASWKGRLSADLIYGLPGQSARGLADDVDTLADLGFGHLSLYELTLSEDAPMAAMAASGGLALPDPETAQEQYDAARERLTAGGYSRYEVSNWCRPGGESLHNLGYWEMTGWLAAGPSASGTLRIPGGFLRMDNPRDDAAYLAAVRADPAAAAAETSILGGTAAFETVMMALRGSAGLDLEDFSARFGPRARALVEEACASFPDLVTRRGDRLAPTDAGMDTLNRVLLACLGRLQEGMGTP